MAALNLPIYAIASFNKEGDIAPVWFRMRDGTYEYRIAEVLSCKDCNHCGIHYLSFVCRVDYEEVSRLVELRYFVESRQWKLFNVLK